jgi:ankyrin repeat protein
LECLEWLSVQSYQGGRYGAIVDLLRSGKINYIYASRLFSFAVLGGCAKQGKWTSVRRLIERKEIFCFSHFALSYAMLWAALSGDLQAVSLLVEQGAQPTFTLIRGYEARTALHMAASAGHLEIVQLLLDLGANVNQRDRYGDTALVTTASNGFLNITEVLINHGADVNAVGLSGYTPLARAAGTSPLEVVRLLVEKGAHLNHRNSHRGTPLLIAAERSDLEMVQYLIDQGAEYNGVVDNDGDDVLTCAAVGGKMDTVKWLMSKGLSCSQRNHEGLTPLENVQRDISLLYEEGDKPEAMERLERLRGVEDFLLSMNPSIA